LHGTPGNQELTLVGTLDPEEPDTAGWKAAVFGLERNPVNCRAALVGSPHHISVTEDCPRTADFTVARRDPNGFWPEIEFGQR